MSSPKGEGSNPGGLPVGEEASPVRFYRPGIGDQDIPKRGVALANTQQQSLLFRSFERAQRGERGKEEDRDRDSRDRERLLILLGNQALRKTIWNLFRKRAFLLSFRFSQS